jgi:uncharacterized protein
MKPFVVNIADLLYRPGARRREQVAGPTTPLSVGDTVVADGADLRVETLLEAVSDGILATGSAEAPWVSTCARCLRPINGSVRGEFREMYSEHPIEEDTYPVVNHEKIDLELVGRDAVLIDLPLAPVCRPDCAGLCPVCGVDHNDTTCACTTEVADPRWAALEGLKFDDPS